MRRVRKTGGASLILTLPKAYTDALEIEAGDYVRIELDDETDAIVVTVVEEE